MEICRLILANVDDRYPVNHEGETPLDGLREWFEEDEVQELEQLWLQYDEEEQ